MIYKYQKKENKHFYENESFYGKVKLEADFKLDNSTLDLCVLTLAKMSSGSGVLESKKGNINYEFEKAHEWVE